MIKYGKLKNINYTDFSKDKCKKKSHAKSFDSFYIRNNNYKLKYEKRKTDLRNSFIEDITKECTFRPNINKNHK